MHSAVERMTLGIVLTAPLVVLGCAGSSAGPSSPSNANTPAAIQTISAWLGGGFDVTTATGVPAGATTIPVVGFPNGQVSQPRDAQGNLEGFSVAFAFSYPDVNRTMVATLSAIGGPSFPPGFGGSDTFSEGNKGFAGCVAHFMTHDGGSCLANMVCDSTDLPTTVICTLMEYDPQGLQFNPMSTATLTVMH